MSEFLDKSALAVESSISIRRWERIFASRQIATVRIGRKILVKREDYLAFMEAKRTPAIEVAGVREQLEQIARKALSR